VITRPREVIKHVLDASSSFMKKELTLEECIGDDVPLEVKTIIHLSFHVYGLHCKFIFNICAVQLEFSCLKKN
jgi:hypothetical protein